METVKHETMILAFVNKHPESNVDAIASGTGVFKLNVYRHLKKLVESKQISIVAKSNPPVYVLVNKSPKGVEDAIPSKIMPEERIGKTPGIAKLTPKSRDTTKFTFQGISYGKARCVWAVIKHHIEKHPKTSLAALKELFPDELVPRYGLIVPVNVGKKISTNDRERFFLKPNEILTLGTGANATKLVVCNQFGSANFPKFRLIAKRIGYNIK